LVAALSDRLSSISEIGIPTASIMTASAGVLISKSGARSRVDEAERQTENSLKQYVDLAAKMGYPAIYRMSMGTELLAEAERVSIEIAKEHPRAIFFVGKLIFQKERWYQRLLHNETALQFQRGVQFAGLNSMVLPVRVFETSPATT
jgi:hypothetical protein